MICNTSSINFYDLESKTFGVKTKKNYHAEQLKQTV